MFNVFVNDGTQEMPNDDILYIVSKEGIFLKKKVGLVESLTKVNKISILDTMGLKETASLDIPKIPIGNFAKIAEFFNEICKASRGEAITLIYFNQKTRKFKFFIPYQLISPGSLNYLTESFKGYDLIGDIHSHGTMGAFHSGVDDHDEQYFDGIHITLGNVSGRDNISISASLVVNGTRFMIEPQDYIEGVEHTESSYSPISFVKGNTGSGVSHFGSLFEGLNTSYPTYSSKNKFYKVLATEEQRIFNQDWLDKVEEKNSFLRVSDAVAYESPVYEQFSDYRENFKKEQDKLVNKGKAATMEISSILDENDENPCATCVFKAHKIDYVIDNIIEDVEEEEEKNVFEIEEDNYISSPEENPSPGLIQKSLDLLRKGGSFFKYGPD